MSEGYCSWAYFLFGLYFQSCLTGDDVLTFLLHRPLTAPGRAFLTPTPTSWSLRAWWRMLSVERSSPSTIQCWMTSWPTWQCTALHPPTCRGAGATCPNPRPRSPPGTRVSPFPCCSLSGQSLWTFPRISSSTATLERPTHRYSSTALLSFLSPAVLVWRLCIDVALSRCRFIVIPGSAAEVGRRHQTGLVHSRGHGIWFPPLPGWVSIMSLLLKEFKQKWDCHQEIELWL